MEVIVHGSGLLGGMEEVKVWQGVASLGDCFKKR